MDWGVRDFARGARLMLTSKTVEAKFLMAPDQPRVNDAIAGIVGRAQRKHKVVIHGVVFMSNHFHVQVTGENPAQIADFMRDVKSCIARELNALRGRSGVFWAARYKLQESTGEDDADVGQLAYVLGHAAKEGLVAEPTDWTGVHSARELLGDGDVTRGTWTDRTAIARTTARKAEREPGAYERGFAIELTPLPSLAGKDADGRRAVLREAVAEVIECERARNGVFRKVTRRSPRLPGWDLRPQDLPESRAAQALRKERDKNRHWRNIGIRAASKEARAALAEKRALIAGLHKEASEAFRARRPAQFPAWTFPPGLPMAGADGLYVPGTRGGRGGPTNNGPRKMQRPLPQPPT